MNKEKEPNYKKRRISLAATGAALVAAGIAAPVLHNMSEYNVIAEKSATLEQGETVEQLARSTVSELAQNNDFNSTNVQDLIDESRQASSENRAINNTEYDQPGDQFNVIVEKNGFGDIKVDVAPLE